MTREQDVRERQACEDWGRGTAGSDTLVDDGAVNVSARAEGHGVGSGETALCEIALGTSS